MGYMKRIKQGIPSVNLSQNSPGLLTDNLSIDCPYCKQKKGSECVTASGTKTEPHKARINFITA